MVKQFFKDLNANEEYDIKCPSGTICIEFNAGARAEFTIMTSDGVMVYSDDSSAHSHSFLIKLGNHFTFVNTTDVVEAQDIATAQFPLTISSNTDCTVTVFKL